MKTQPSVPRHILASSIVPAAVAAKRSSFLSRIPKSLAVGLGLSVAGMSPVGPQAANGAETWTGATNTWNTAGNWTGDNLPPISGDALIFDAAGAGGLLLNNDLTSAAFSIAGITFNAGAGAFVIGDGTATANAGNTFVLTGNVINNSTSLETINNPFSMTAVRTFTTTAGGGDITLGGNISGAGGGITKLGAGTLTLSGANTNTGLTTITAGTLKLGANNALTTTGNVTLSTGGLTNTFDLAGFTQTINTLASGTVIDSAGTITSSVAGGSLTINTGSTNGNTFGGTRFTGTLALTLRGTSTGNVQVLNPNNSFSGGLTIKSSNAASLTTANLATAGGLTGQVFEGLRSNATGALGTGAINLDNGQLFMISSLNVANAINVSARGGVLHMEGTTASANGGFLGTLSSTGTALMVVNSNSGNNNIIKLGGDMSGFSGTIALDTTNLGGIALTGSAFGSANANLLWFGSGANGGTGRLQWKNTVSGTMTFGELNNLNSGAIGSTMSGVVENATAATIGTLSLGNSNATAATFQGVIRNGAGTMALTKTGSNTQILSGANTYTGATTISGGTLKVTGSLAFGSAISIDNGGTLNVTGSVGPVAVNGGGTLGGSGSVTGPVTVASGSTAATQGTISLVNASVGTLTLSDASGLNLGGTAGDLSLLNFEANSSTADKISLGGNVLTVGAGGANITVSSLGVVAGVTYDLITFGSGAGDGFATGSGSTTIGSLTLTNPSLGFGVSGTLTVSGTAVQLVTTGAGAPATAYWSGAKGPTWASNDGVGGNFTTTDGGAIFVSANPSATTDVFFTNSAPVTNTLGTGFDIKSLTFSGTGTTTINSDGNILTLESAGLTVQGGAGAVTIGATLSGDGSVTNAGTLTLSGTNSYTGGTTNASGTLTAGSTSAFGASTSPLAVTGGTVDLNGNSQTVGELSGNAGAVITNNSSTADATLTASGASDSTYTGALNDGGNGRILTLVKSGTGMLILSGSNTYSGATTVSGGTLQLGSADALGTTAGATSISGGATLDLNGQTIGETLHLSGAGLGGAGALINSNAGTPATVSVDTPDSVSFTIGGAGDINLQRVGSANTGQFTLTKVGAGTVTTAGTSHNNLLNLILNDGTFVAANAAGFAIDRTTTINAGTLRLSGANTNLISDNNAFTVNGGEFDLNGKSETISAVNGFAGFIENFLSSSTSTLTVGGGDTSASYSGMLRDNPGIGAVLALAKTGAGTQTLAGANTHGGNSTVNAGTLALANLDALQLSTLDTGAAGAQTVAFAVGGTNTYNLGGLSGADALDAGDNSLSVGANNASTTSTGDITAAALTKVGTGTLHLTGTQTYGTLTTTGGTTDVDSAIGTGTSTVNANATTNFTVSQTLAALNIGSGALASFGEGPEFAAAGFGGGASIATVPEPGAALSLLGGLGLLLGLRRRRG